MKNSKMMEPGKWYAEFDESGSCTSAVYDASFRRLIGYEPGDGSACSHGLPAGTVHPDDRERLNAHVAECLKRHPEGMDFDIEYRMMTKRGYRWFHNFGLCTRREDGSVVRCDGAAFDIHGIVSREDARKKQIARMAGGESSYIVNPETERFIILTQNRHLAENYNAEEDFNSSFSRYIESDVYEPDRKEVAEKINVPAMVRHLESNDEYTVRYRDISSGDPRWYEMRAVRLSDSEILYGFSDKNDEVIGDLLYSRMRENYFGLYYVNLDADLAHIIKTGHPVITGEAGSTVRYEKLIKSIVSESEGDAVSFLSRIVNSDYISLYFADKDIAYHTYKSYIFESSKWVNATGLVLDRHEDGSPSVFALGFSLLDEDEAAKEEAALRLSDSMKVVGGLASEFTALYHVNLDTDEYVPYHLVEKIEDIKPLYEGCSRFSDLSRRYAESSLVSPDDCENLKQFYPSAEAVKERMKDKKRLSLLFRRNYGGKYLWTEAIIVKCEEEHEEARNLIIGFIEKDREIREMDERTKEAEEAGRLIENMTQHYNLVYTVNMADDSFRVLRIDDNVLGREKNFKSFSDIRDFFFSEIIHPADRERMLSEFDYRSIRRKLSGAGSYSVEYRALVNGTTNWNEMNISPLSADDIVIGFSLDDQGITQRHLEEKRFDEYLALFVIDLDTRMIKPMKISPFFTTAAVGEAVMYEPAMKLFASSYDDVEVKEFFTRISNVDYLRQEFAAEDKRSFSFKSSKIAQDKWIDATAYVLNRGDDGAPSMLSLGFSVADVMATARKELLSKLDDDLHMIGGLADRYDTLYYVNINEKAFRIYALDGEKYPQTSSIVSGETDAFEAVRLFGSSPIVHPDDRHIFAELSVESVRKRLAHSKRFCLRYRQADGGDFVWFEMEVVKYEEIDEPANALAIGFTNRDAEIRSELAADLEQRGYQLAILNSAYSYSRINLSKNSIIPPIIEREHGQPVDYTDKFPTPLPSYEDVFSIGAARYVDDDYKESYKAYHNCAFLISCFNEGNMMPEYVCRIYSTTIGWHYRKYVTYLSRDISTGEIYGMSVAYDITEEHEAEEREKQYQAELAKAYEAAKAASRSKSSFLFNMSHDIRTPMNAITGFTGMAKKYIDDREKVADYLEKIDSSGKQLLTLINRVLEMARIESGKIELEENHVNVRDEFDTAVTVLSEQAKVNGLEFDHSLIDLTHNHVIADAAKMSSITLNITGNAMKYTPKGGRIDFVLKEIPPRREGYASFVFTVADTGIGMSEEYLKVMFDPFTREKSSTVSRIQGTGLGLSIVKELVDFMGGSIDVQSKPGKGTRFDITIDLRIDENADTVKKPVLPDKTVSLEGRSVLLVEDNELNREIAFEILEEEGLLVEDADDGTVAVKMLSEKGPDYYDFILMDIQMPVLNGYEAARLIREMYPDKRIPIIALSANAFAEDKAASIAAGMDAHVAKPINVKELLGVLAEFL